MIRRAIAAAEQANVSYLDQNGFGRIVHPGFVYIVRPPVSGNSSKLSRVSPFAPKASRIARSLLAEPSRKWRLSDLAGITDVDPGNAHRILGALLDLDLIERDDDLYSVPDPGSLLEAWAESSRRPGESIVLRLSEKPHKILRRMVESHPDGFAVSGEVAAESMAPHLDSRQALLHCLDAGALDAVDDIQDELPYPVQPSARIVAVRSDPHAGDFGSDAEGMRLVSPAQLYVDLFRERGRGRQAGERVRQEVLGF